MGIKMSYQAAPTRYDTTHYNRCGKSGLKLPAISLGLWHNFGHADDIQTAQKMLFTAFDHGVTHFDLANNYGPPPGSAEATFGQIFKKDLAPYRDEMIISTKAGYLMWPGPYGEWGSKKYMLASLDQSLKRMGLDYVDIFYSHRPDPDTPLEETMDAMAQAVRQGKTLYVGLSNYYTEETLKAQAILKDMGIPLLIHQTPYSMLRRDYEQDNIFSTLDNHGVGSICFSPLAQGLLSDKYLEGIPADSRAAKENTFLKKETVTAQLVDKLKKLNDLAAQRGQTLAQMAIAWVLHQKSVCSALVGASRPEQMLENLKTLDNIKFTNAELAEIETVLT